MYTYREQMERLAVTQILMHRPSRRALSTYNIEGC